MSVHQRAAAHFDSRKQMAPHDAGRTEEPGIGLGDLDARNKAQGPRSSFRTEPPGLMAQSPGCYARLGGAHGSLTGAPSRSCCDNLQKCGMAGNYEGRRSWRSRSNLETSQENWVRGFEHALSAILGRGWWAEAKKSCRKNWQRGKFIFMGEAIRHWGGPKLINKKYTLESLAPVIDENLI